MKFFRKRSVRGSISIFLVIILIPTMLLSAVLIDGSRVSSAKAMTQEAADLAATSALADYNQDLKDDFGLFAIKDADKLKNIYEESLKSTLMAYGISGNAEYSDRIWDIMKTSLTGETSYMGKSFLNLYDFSVEKCEVEPLYCLAEPSVLENQMVEYAKFRGIYVMADRLDLFNNLGQISEEAKQNKESSKVMANKMDVDEDNAAADRALVELRNQISSLNDTIAEVKQAKEQYLIALRGKMEEIKYNNIDTDEDLPKGYAVDAKKYKSSQTTLKNSAKAACTQAKNVLKQAETAKKQVEKAITRLKTFISENSGKASGNETVKELIQDAERNIKTYEEEYLPAIQKLLDDSILNEMKSDNSNIASNLEKIMDDIDEAITYYIEVIEEMQEAMEEDSDESGDDEEEEITEYYYYYLTGTRNTMDADVAIGRGQSNLQYYDPAITKPVKYFLDKKWDPEQLNPSNKYNSQSSSKISEDFASTQSGNTGNADTNQEGEAERGEVEQKVYDARPSKTYASESGKNNDTNFFNKNGDLTSSKNILKQSENSMLLEIGEAVRDDVLSLSYMFGTFKTRLTGVKKFSSEGMSSKDKNSYYMPDWRYAYPDGELDMRFTPKKDRDTVLRSEIEYLVYGNRTDKANEAAVYATIFGERLANNLMAMYREKEVVNPACHEAAGLASAATAGAVPETVFFWIFLTAWATAETVIEMNYLISDGYRIPLLKTKNNILLNEFPDADGEGLIENYNAKEKKTILVSYEDYLLILLLIKGRDIRIRRTADLIEMNMKKNGASDFTMAKAYTYLHADTEMTIRYLFGEIKPFQEEYEGQGYKGRIHFTNTIYQGY
ncbi:MAG: DUF5702 domain-containing protein [Brotaphodocola sp.]